MNIVEVVGGNIVEVVGGNKGRREIAEKVVCWYINNYLNRFRTLDIKVALTNCFKNGAYGWCMSNTRREFELEIDKSLNLYDFISTICHEMVHVKQYARGEMVPLPGGKTRWKKKVFGDIAYDDSPWEKEAFRLEKSLALKCFTEVL
jgi:hypothetical protein